MRNKVGFYFKILVALVVCTTLCSSQVTINGVSHVCQNPEGRLGRCTSKTNCLHQIGCDRNASIWECPHGHGHPPYVCCIFRKSAVVFPDDDDNDGSVPGYAMAMARDSDSASASATSTSTTTTTSAPHVEFRSLLAPSLERAVLFPDENGNFDIPSPTLGISERVLQRWLSLKNKLRLLPKPPVCGPMILGDKIHGGVEAQLGEFPWLVNLEYRTEDGELEIGCSGNILNHRYVITAAHCVRGLIEELLGKLESLRVGDHNTAMARDCDDLGCIDPFERFGVIERVIHEKYFETKKGRLFNDIALLKTDRNISYSFSVAPICLPNVIKSLQPLVTGARLTVAGWGNNGTAEYTDEKRIVDVPYVDNTNCPMRVEPTQLCAGGVQGKDSCTGDSGGSLARRAPGAWVMEGIVSYGRKCGSNKPAIYTRVRSFIPWILEHVMEP